MIRNAFCLLLLVFAGTVAGPLSADTYKAGGTGGALGYLREVSRSAPQPGQFRVIPSLGSGGGNKALIAGVIDVSISGRPLKPSEIDSGLVARPLFRSPFVFVTSRKEPVDVNRQDIWRLFERPSSPNAYFGGDRVRIILRSAPDSDLSFAFEHIDGFQAIYDTIKDIPGVPFVLTDQENADLAETLEDSLTTGTLVQMLTERRRLNFVSVDGVVPSAQAIETGAYPFAKTFYVVVRKDSSQPAKDFVEFLFSEEGRRLAADFGALVLH